MNKSDLVKLRQYKEADKHFVLATFLRGLYYGNELFNLIPKNIFMENYHKIAEALLDRQGLDISVACLKEDEDVILGYAIFSSDSQVLNWMFVKSAWRNIGIAKSLMRPGTRSVSHLSKVGVNLLKKYPNIVFNPFFI